MADEVKNNLPGITDEQVRLLAINLISNLRTLDTSELADEVRARVSELLIKTAGPDISAQPQKMEKLSDVSGFTGAFDEVTDDAAAEYERGLSLLTAIDLISCGKTLETATNLTDETKIDVWNFLTKTAGSNISVKPQAGAGAAEEAKPVDVAGNKEPRILSPDKQAEFLSVLEARFAQNPGHYKRPDVDFAEVKAVLEASPALMYSLSRMEEAGGAPDIIAVEKDAFIFADCSAESPDGRREINYDQATERAKKSGIEFMDASTYRSIQEIGKFDLHTQSWLLTPEENTTGAGYALCGSRVGDRVCISVFDAGGRDDRGWRGVLRIPTRKLSPDEQAEFLSVLGTRFAEKPEHYKRLKDINFAEVRASLEANPALMYSLAQMEQTGGEPDIIAVEADAFIFADCSAESPEGRRNCVYDKEAEKNATDFDGNAVDRAKEFGVDMMSASTYHEMQKLGKFDVKTYSWLKTPADIRHRHNALCGTSYQGGDLIFARWHHYDKGWRGVLRVPKV